MPVTELSIVAGGWFLLAQASRCLTRDPLMDAAVDLIVCAILFALIVFGLWLADGDEPPQ